MGKKWEKGTIVKQVRLVTYLINNFQKIFQKHIDQLKFTQTLKSIINIFVKAILQYIQKIKYSPHHKIPIEHHLLNQILNKVLSVKIGRRMQHLIQILVQP